MRARILVLVLAVAAVVIPGTAQASQPWPPTINMPLGCSEAWPTVGTVTTATGKFYTVTSHPLVCTAASGYKVGYPSQTTQDYAEFSDGTWGWTCGCGGGPLPPTVWVTGYPVGGGTAWPPLPYQWRAVEIWSVYNGTKAYFVRTWTGGHPF